jgi:hypothetical protein
MQKTIRGLSKLVLIVLQWLLVLLGIFQILIVIHLYVIDVTYFSSLPEATADQVSYNPRTFQRLLSGVAAGMVSVGVGAGLFYLRRIFLRQKN